MFAAVSRASMGLWLALILIGCDTPPPQDNNEDPLSLDEAPPRDQIAAMVDGYPIRVSDVRSLMTMESEPLTPTDALQILIEQQLLAKEAVNRGYAPKSAIETESRRSSALALARKIATETTIDTLDKNKLQIMYDRQKPNYVHGPKRQVIHAVARVGKRFFSDKDGKAAIDLVKAATLDAKSKKHFRSLVKGVRRNSFKGHNYRSRLKTENLPSFAKDSKTFDPDFVSATWSIEKPGEMSGVIKTKFGYHVIMLVEEIPALNRPFEEVWREIGARVLLTETEMRIDALIARLRKQSKVFVYESNLSVQGDER